MPMMYRSVSRLVSLSCTLRVVAALHVDHLMQLRPIRSRLVSIGRMAQPAYATCVSCRLGDQARSSGLLVGSLPVDGRPGGLTPRQLRMGGGRPF